MEPEFSRRRQVSLALWAALGLAYLAGLTVGPTLLGSHRLDGAVGIVLGLFLGSHPAANSIDRLFVGRGQRPGPGGALWLALNGLVLLVSLLVLAVGATQFSAGA